LTEVKDMSVSEQIGYVTKHIRECLESSYLGQLSPTEAEQALIRMLVSQEATSVFDTTFETPDGNLVRFAKEACENTRFSVKYDDLTNSYKIVAALEEVNE